jgi:protein-tyrosine phosphatase
MSCWTLRLVPGFEFHMKATIYPINAAAPNRVAIVARPRGGDWLRDEVSALSTEGIDVLVSMLTEEESIELGLESESEDCEAVAIEFVSLPIPDRSVPSDADDFLRSVERLAEMVRDGRSLAVHCRASIGRSSVLAVSVLVRLGWNANEAFHAVESARGCSIPDTPEQRQWVIQNIPATR